MKRLGGLTALAATSIIGALGISGCNTGDAHRRNEFYPAIAPRVGVDIISYETKYPASSETTFVHDADGGPSKGSARAQIKGYDSAGFKLGLEGSVGWDYLRLKTGFDTRFNSNSSRNSYRTYQGDSETAPQPIPWQSYAYTQTWNSPMTYIPFVGIESNLDWLKLGVEYGWPKMGFNVERGHDRYGKWETVEKQSWNGTGSRLGTYIGVRPGGKESPISFLFEYAQENYGVKFGKDKGKVKAETYGIKLAVEFW